MAAMITVTLATISITLVMLQIPVANNVTTVRPLSLDATQNEKMLPCDVSHDVIQRHEHLTKQLSNVYEKSMGSSAGTFSRRMVHGPTHDELEPDMGTYRG